MVAGSRKMLAFPHFTFYWQRSGSQISQLFTMCWGLQLQIENIRGFYTSRWFHESCWDLICMKILKNNLRDLLSNICFTLPMWILYCHSKVKSAAPACLQPSIPAKSISYCFLPGVPECTWTQHNTEALAPVVNPSVRVPESDCDRVAVAEDNSSLCFRIQRISTWLDDIYVLDIWILTLYVKILVFLFCFHLVFPFTYHP